jgi:hypothetical protein
MLKTILRMPILTHFAFVAAQPVLGRHGSPNPARTEARELLHLDGDLRRFMRVVCKTEDEALMKIITTILVVLITTAAVGQKCLPPQLGQSYCASFATLISPFPARAAASTQISREGFIIDRPIQLNVCFTIS